MDRTWMSANRMSKEYRDGVKEFVRVAVAHAKDINKIICPCLKCCYKDVSADDLETHLIWHGIDKSYTCWTMHGEKKTKSTNFRSSVRDTSNDFERDTYEFDRVEEFVNVVEEDLRDCPKMFERLIHACPNDCVLFRNEYASLNMCPKCSASRYKKETAPAKVLWYFPIIPRFRRMYRNEEDAKHLTWHADERVVDGMLRHPADSPQWAKIDADYPDFGHEPRNIRLALSTDGINPHGIQSSSHSTWPVIMLIYNLPPWLCMKRKFVMLTMLISGPKQPGNDIDIYLAPLIEDLKLMWETGVEVYDECRKEFFNLRAILFGTINDFPAYGNLSGYSIKGKSACPICGDDTNTMRLEKCKKSVFLGHRRFLNSNHRYRKWRQAFNGNSEEATAPLFLTGDELHEKDGINARLDLQLMGLRKELNPVKKKNKTYLPPAAHTLSRKEKTTLCRFLQEVKVPEGYSSNIRSLVSMKDLKLKNLKSHDCHVLMENFLPIGIRSILPEKVRWTITKLCFFFKAICSKVIDPGKLLALQKEIVETLFEEAIEFCTEYLSNVESIGIPVSRHSGRTTGEGIGASKVVTISNTEKEQAHLYVLHNSVEVEPYVEKHMEQLKILNPNRNENWLTREHNRSFISWLRNHIFLEFAKNPDSISQRLRWLATGPNVTVLSYSRYVINNHTFYTKERDHESTMQNSGVTLVAQSLHVSSANDRNPLFANMSYFGVIERIWELDYSSFQVPVFGCKWVDNNNGVQIDDYGFVKVDLNRVGYRDEPFILASQATQVFYVTDPSDEKCRKKKRTRGVTLMRKVFKAKSSGIKLEVTWNDKGQPIGDNSRCLSSFIGLTARRIVPIYFDHWNTIDKTIKPALDAYKQDIWDEIRSAFVIGDEHYDYVMTVAGTCLRAFRTKLTSDYVRDSDGNVIRQRPSQYSHVIEQEHWDIFVAKRETEEFQKISKENRERALNPQHPYKKGRQGYARLVDDMIKETGEKTISQVTAWVSARVGKDGKIDNENVQSVKDKCDKLTQSLTEEEKQNLGPTDILFKALDLPEYSGRVRSYGRQQPEKMAERQQPEKMAERQQSEDVLERPQQSAKDSYNPVDIDSIPKGISPINIYLGFSSRRLVARGKLHNTEGDTVHGIKLPPGYVKVAIDVSIISDAPLPISIEYGEVSTVGQAIGTIVPWPFKLVELNVECQKIPKKIHNKDKVQSSESVASPTKNRKILKKQVVHPKNVGSAGLQKLKFLDDYTKFAWKSGTVMEIDMRGDIFSVGFTELLHLENIKEIVDHDWLSASVITLYARYLYDKLIGPRGLTHKISFLSPHVSYSDIEGNDIASRLIETKVLKDEKIILAPYNIGIHWVLFVINPNAEDIYFLDPLGGEPSDHGSIKTKFENAIQIYRAWCENKISKSKKDKIKWHKIKCPRQINTIDCGYFIMRFMKEVIMEYPNKIPDNYFHRHRHSTYSKGKLDEVKEEWATYMVEDVINDAKRRPK
ncbi:hypothetical protein QL285_031156 [Trifolium repens]|nr:hypothetical protein QL285_031156 [Trifolium repens]